MGKINIILLIIIIIVVVLIAAAIIINPDILTTNSLKNADIAKEIYGFAATIKKINNNILTYEAMIPLADLTKEPIKTTLKTTISDETKIIKLKFPADIINATESVYPEQIPLKLSDLKVGDIINISSTANIYDSLKNGTEFAINDIFIVEK